MTTAEERAEWSVAMKDHYGDAVDRQPAMRLMAHIERLEREKALLKDGWQVVSIGAKWHVLTPAYTEMKDAGGAFLECESEDRAWDAILEAEGRDG